MCGVGRNVAQNCGRVEFAEARLGFAEDDVIVPRRARVDNEQALP
jgi:hypothetical protein